MTDHPHIYFDAVRDFVSDHFGIAPDKVTMESTLVDDIGADSLDVIDLVMAVEDRWNIAISSAMIKKIITIDDLCRAIRQSAESH